MAFDADAYLESLNPPEITINGKTYKGRFLSIEEWLPFEPRLQAVANQELSVPEIQKVVKDFCEVVFPAPWSTILNPWNRTVGEQVIHLPPAALMKAAADFFGSQVRAMNGKKQESPPSQEA